ncbi:hypothetical protein HF325_000199 [Metschnikowia pulcherrima]|uniref:Secreted RxLR effector peptide protein n=1 Tax=Metschnikowia pulcherrima TaxID=27326 RepID=A0A8H7GXI0_9ASCO|nr:hypothetical protein HF325_000199 [Metschnikowia pulcherrima]
MKLTIIAALVAIAPKTGTGDVLHKRETVQENPKTNVELIYKLSHVRDALNEALENDVSPHRWYFAKQDVAGLVEAAKIP